MLPLPLPLVFDLIGLLLYVFIYITLNAIRFGGRHSETVGGERIYNFARETVAFDKISFCFMQETDLETTLQRQM